MINAFLHAIHIGPLWNKLVKKLPTLTYREMSRMVPTLITVENMANHHRNELDYEKLVFIHYPNLVFTRKKPIKINNIHKLVYISYNTKYI